MTITETMSPSEIDTILADLWHRTNVQRQYLHSAREGVRYEAGQRHVGYGRKQRWDGEYEAAMDTLVARMDGDDFQARQARKAIERVQEHAQAIEALRSEARPYEAEYAARRWNRYFLVTNGNGHVHRGMDCSTCYPTTQYAWLPELSGCDEAAMVDEFGEKACTICFPDAPALPAFHRPGRRDAAAKAARDAEKAARDAAKAAKAITDIDGSPLRDSMGSIVRTKVAARNALAWAVESATGYGRTTEDNVHIARLTAALEAAGVDTAPVIARATKKGKAWAR